MGCEVSLLQSLSSWEEIINKNNRVVTECFRGEQFSQLNEIGVLDLERKQSLRRIAPRDVSNSHLSIDRAGNQAELKWHEKSCAKSLFK